MDPTSLPFVLCADSRNHSADVKSVCAGPDRTVFSASRDRTARCFRINATANSDDNEDEDNALSDELVPTGRVLEGHLQFVNCVLYHPCVPFLDGEPAVFTGANDHHIVAWSPTTGAVEAVLDGHADGVKCLALLTPSMAVVSGSWDKSAVVWDIHTGGIAAQFAKHGQPVLCAAQVGDVVVTGSGDRTLMAWLPADGALRRTFKGHTDSVQCVAAVGPDTFVSGSNDALVLLWTMSSDAPLRTLFGHEGLVLGVCVLPSTGEVVSASDDRTLRVWTIDDAPRCTQTIELPSTAWAVAALPRPDGTDDICAGSADAVVRVFTRKANESARPAKIEALAAEITAQRIDIKAAAAAGHSLDVANMPSVQQMGTIAGEREGQRKLFREENGLVAVYAWTRGAWARIGTVVAGEDQAGFTGQAIPKQKQYHDGKAWDYVFDVDISGQMLKLTYNRGESIFEAAQRFINDYGAFGVSQMDKEAIQQHLLNHIDPADAALVGAGTAPVARAGAAGAGAGAGASGTGVVFSDFARESAAMAARGEQEIMSWREAKERMERTGRDVAFSTFMQEEQSNATQQAQAAAGQAQAQSSAQPALYAAPEVFAAFSAEVVKKKTAELFGGSHEFDHTIDAAAAAAQAAIMSDAASDALIGLSAMFAALDTGSRFPALDALRFAASGPALAAAVAEPDGLCADLLAHSIASPEAMQALPTDPERLVALRLVANIAANAPAAAASAMPAYLSHFVRPIAALPAASAPQRAAVVAVLRNVAVAWSVLGPVADMAAAFMSTAAAAAVFGKDPQQQERVLAAVRTLLQGREQNAGLLAATRTALETFIRNARRHSDPALAAAASHIHNIIKSDE